MFPIQIRFDEKNEQVNLNPSITICSCTFLRMFSSSTFQCCDTDSLKPDPAFKMNPDPVRDPDPGFCCPVKNRKNAAENLLSFFFSKIALQALKFITRTLFLFYYLLWVIFAFLDLDPDTNCESGSGSRKEKMNPVRIRSNPDPEPDPQHWTAAFFLN